MGDCSISKTNPRVEATFLYLLKSVELDLSYNLSRKITESRKTTLQQQTWGGGINVTNYIN